MAVVTAIKQQKRSDSRYSVYLDENYAFALSDLDLSTSGLRVGTVLTEAEVEEFKKSAEQSKVYGLALSFLSFRNRSRQEMADYLRRKEVPPTEIEAVITRLIQGRLINDEQFASAWVANRMSLRTRSKRRLEQELQAKGVPRDDIAAALDEVSDEAELAGVVSVIERKRGQSQYQDPQKLMAYLARQGYPYDLIKKALEQTDRS